MPKIVDRYHKEIFFPKNSTEILSKFIEGIFKSSSITFSLHAVEKVVKIVEMYGKVLAGEFFKMVNSDVLFIENVFEFYLNKDGKVEKACFRAELNKLPVDIIFVISSTGVIITVYTTNRGDNHTTINKKLYSTK